MHRLTRRQFLATNLASLVVSPRLMATVAEPDIVVVGAGAAGLAATRTLVNKGLHVVLVEAAHRIGGRAYTDNKIFGLPYDQGAHWLHHGKRNPFYMYAKANGFDVYPAPEVYRLFSNSGKPVSERESEVFWDTYEAMIQAISKAGKSSKDIAASEAISHLGGRWIHTARLFEGPWTMAKNVERFSTLDWWNGEDGKDYFCKSGFGTVVEHFSRGLVVNLNTAVTRIDWGNQRVIVQTSNGVLKPKTVIVTVSTGVLAAGAIEFVPALTLEKRESFDAISMGAYDRIALHFSPGELTNGIDEYLLFEVDSDERGFVTLMNVSGSGLCYCDIGGDWALELQRHSDAFKIDYALTQLKSMLGSAIQRHFVKGATTAWGLNPLIRGAYASAAPGKHAMRTVLRQPVGERVFFAGEACHKSLWGTVGGAYLSGIATAESVLEVIR